MATTVTAQTVRAYFNADEARLARLSDAARKTVEFVDGKAPRGRLHADAVKAFNAKRRKTARYESGATKRVAQEQRDAAKALRAQAIAAGVAREGSRGPLPKAFLATLKA